MGPKEDKDAKRDAKQQRKMAKYDRREQAEENASGLTSDLRAVYGLRGLANYGQRGGTSAKTG